MTGNSKTPAWLCLLLCLFGSTWCMARGKSRMAVRGTILLENHQMISLQSGKSNSRMDSSRTILKKPLTGENALSSDSTIVHVVKQKETLYSIAQKYGVSVTDLKQWNNLTNNVIYIGEKLKIYARNENQPVTSTSVGFKSGQGQYTVKPEDTLFSISQKFHISVERLKVINNLTSNTIHIGQKLIVKPAELTSSNEKSSGIYGEFISYTIKKTVPLDTLLAKFNMGKTEFLELNPGFNNAIFHRGDQIEVLLSGHHSRKNPYRVDNNRIKGAEIMLATKYPPHNFGPTTNGELYNPEALTAGSPTLDIGSVVYVENRQNGRGVFVRINDRTTRKGLRLSKAAWDALKLTDDNRKVMVSHIHEQPH